MACTPMHPSSLSLTWDKLASPLRARPRASTSAGGGGGARGASSEGRVRAAAKGAAMRRGSVCVVCVCVCVKRAKGWSREGSRASVFLGGCEVGRGGDASKKQKYSLTRSLSLSLAHVSLYCCSC